MATTGVVQFCGTVSGEVFSPIGMVTGGTWGLNSNASKRRGIGGRSYIQGGLMYPTLTLTYLPGSTNCLLTSVLRTVYPGGLPPAISTLEVGNDTTADQFAASYVNTAELEVSVDEALSVNLEVVNLGPTSAGTAARTMAELPTFEWYDAVVGLGVYGETNLDAQRIRVAINNNLQLTGSLDTKASDLRYADIIAAGREEVTVEVDVLTDPGYDMGADYIKEEAIAVSLTAGNGISTITVAVTEAVPVEWTQALVTDDWALWTVRCEVEDNSEGVTITVA